MGTIFHRSHIPLAKWLVAFHMMCSSKKGISALQLQRELELGSYQTAWHMCHRIRHAMREKPMASMLSGDVEADETYIGPRKPRYKGTSRKGRGTNKAPVVVLVERGGRARAMSVDRVTGENLGRVLRENVDPSSRLLTDEWAPYKTLGKRFKGGHETVTHSKGEYARGDIHNNTAESFNALLKRGVVGAFHHVSRRHLPRYCDEFSFRWSTRHMSDGERTVLALAAGDGERLCYDSPSCGV